MYNYYYRNYNQQPKSRYNEYCPYEGYGQYEYSPYSGAIGKNYYGAYPYSSYYPGYQPQSYAEPTGYYYGYAPSYYGSPYAYPPYYNPGYQPQGYAEPTGYYGYNAPYNPYNSGYKGYTPGTASGVTQPYPYQANSYPTYGMLDYRLLNNDREYIIETSAAYVDQKNFDIAVVGYEIRLNPNATTSEKSYGYYTIPVPQGVDYSKVTANIDGDKLKIYLPKYIEAVKLVQKKAS